MRIEVDPNNPLADGLPYLFEAFFEYEVERLGMAARDKKYNPRNPRNQNDAFDSEQLIFLTYPNHFLQHVMEDTKSELQNVVRPSGFAQ
jgi:hypothetical protein